MKKTFAFLFAACISIAMPAHGPGHLPEQACAAYGWRRCRWRH